MSHNTHALFGYRVQSIYLQKERQFLCKFLIAYYIHVQSSFRFVHAHNARSFQLTFRHCALHILAIATSLSF